MRVEPKGLSLTVHYRGDPGLEAAVRDWAEHEAARSGLVLRDARMSIELHPPIAADKGTAVAELAGSFDAVCFIGDDRGDLPAFAALDELAARGASTVRVPELLARADLVVEGPEGAAALLRSL
jgi:trehalose 6-phosphate phosphatase